MRWRKFIQMCLLGLQLLRGCLSGCYLFLSPCPWGLGLSGNLVGFAQHANWVKDRVNMLCEHHNPGKVGQLERQINLLRKRLRIGSTWRSKTELTGRILKAQNTALNIEWLMDCSTHRPPTAACLANQEALFIANTVLFLRNIKCIFFNESISLHLRTYW